MNIYLAPMEGITGHVYRNAYNNVYGKIDKYFTPFIVPVLKREFKKRELRDILPENNKNMVVVPQILSNNAVDTLRTIENLKKYGYNEVNINMGCPSGTVVSKNKGAGFLAFPELIDKYLKELIVNTDVKISIKMRIGMEKREEAYELLKVMNNHKLHEVIIHPRLRMDYYKNDVDMEMFDYIYNNSINPISYNGDIKTKENFDMMSLKYPDMTGIMIGRGIIAKPYLIDEITNEKCEIYKSNIAKMKEFHDKLLEGYKEIIKEEINVLYKMKEVWNYLSENFEKDCKQIKSIRKARSISEYEIAVNNLFSLLNF